MNNQCTPPTGYVPPKACLNGTVSLPYICPDIYDCGAKHYNMTDFRESPKRERYLALVPVNETIALDKCLTKKGKAIDHDLPIKPCAYVGNDFGAYHYTPPISQAAGPTTTSVTYAGNAYIGSTYTERSQGTTTTLLYFSPTPFSELSHSAAPYTHRHVFPLFLAATICCIVALM